jgi:hypothetical protein
MNRKFLMTAVVALGLTPAIGIGVAEAHGGGGGGGHGGGFGGRGFGGGGFHDGGFGRGGFGVGFGYYGGGFYDPYGYDYGYAYPQPYSQVMAGAPSSQNVWYFCPPTKTYYPYVQSCSVSWQAVPAVASQ